MNIIKKGFLSSALIGIIFLFIFNACNTPNITKTETEEEKDIQILNPDISENIVYPNFQTMVIICKFKRSTVKSPMISFSTDKKEWKFIQNDNINHSFYADSSTQENKFDYIVYLWVPEKDSLSNQTIYLKARGYDAEPGAYADIIGPIKIE